MIKDKFLVIGSSGQIGTDLCEGLRNIYGSSNVVAADIHPSPNGESGPFEELNILDAENLRKIIVKHSITEVYLLAALLSANAEKNPAAAWHLNMHGLFNVLELAKEKLISKIFWPSSIAVFGPHSPKNNTPQHTVADPLTVYGISKLAGERWCEYYFKTFGVDVRSIRYPGLIGYKSKPGGGTTDYAVHIFNEAITQGKYECFLKEDAILPMMYMPDAIEATIRLMNCDSSKINIRSSYNITGMSFSPAEIAREIKKHYPDFVCTYKPDFRQEIAKTWPHSIDDSSARLDWGWTPSFNLESMTSDMILHLAEPKVSNI